MLKKTTLFSFGFFCSSNAKNICILSFFQMCHFAISPFEKLSSVEQSWKLLTLQCFHFDQEDDTRMLIALKKNLYDISVTYVTFQGSQYNAIFSYFCAWARFHLQMQRIHVCPLTFQQKALHAFMKKILFLRNKIKLEWK